VQLEGLGKFKKFVHLIGLINYNRNGSYMGVILDLCCANTCVGPEGFSNDVGYGLA
jgi:hypothetical protein